MVELSKEKIKEGRKQLGGIRILYWFEIVISAILIIAIVPPSMTAEYIVPLGLPVLLTQVILALTVEMVFAGIFLVLSIIALVGIKRRRPYSIPLGRALLVLLMFNIPIGTIIGAILWKRFSHPEAKKYLNYGT